MPAGFYLVLSPLAAQNEYIYKYDYELLLSKALEAGLELDAPHLLLDLCG